MGWERRTEADTHRCDLPGEHHLVWGTLTGNLGDLFRCDDCGTLWRVGRACNLCDRARANVPHGGQHADGLDWRTATPWQRLTYRRGRGTKAAG